MIKYFFDNAPEIIKAASSSKLGIFALMVLAISGLALAFFRKEALWVRVLIFLVLFSGMVGFSTEVAHQTNTQLAQQREHESIARAQGIIDTQNIPKASEAHDLTAYFTDHCLGAKKNLDWIFTDKGAAVHYERLRKSGLTRYQAAVHVQDHNLNAKKTIIACGKSAVERYLQGHDH